MISIDPNSLRYHHGFFVFTIWSFYLFLVAALTPKFHHSLIFETKTALIFLIYSLLQKKRIKITPQFLRLTKNICSHYGENKRWFLWTFMHNLTQSIRYGHHRSILAYSNWLNQICFRLLLVVCLKYLNNSKTLFSIGSDLSTS